MANTTNFGWETPDDTDLVKDGAAAMRTLGNAIDASFVDLKGGTTGQVLSKASNTDLDYTWVTTDDANAIQNAIVDAKGDLIAATANDTPARLAVGSNGDTLVADSAATTGLRWQGSQAAGKNWVINGNFDIWQRGTSFTNLVVSGFAADRWQITSGTQTATLSQQTTGAPIGSRYVLRNAYTAAGSYGNFYQHIETNNASQLWGRTVTLTAKLRKNASLTTDLNLVIAKSSTVDAGYGATWTTIQSTTIGNASLPTGTGSSDWYTATVTATIPNDGTANSIRVGIAEVSTQPSGAYWEISQVQLELGSVGTSFTRAGGTIQGELSICRRYYQVLGKGRGVGSMSSTTQASLVFGFDTTMRITPTSIIYSTLSNSIHNPGVAFYTPTSLTLSAASPYGAAVNAAITGATAKEPAQWWDNEIGFNAEL